MKRIQIIKRVGEEYLTSNIENGEFSYVLDAGSKENLKKALGKEFTHYKIDLRFESEDIVILVETKQKFTDKDEMQLKEYLEEEKALHPAKKIICILANTNDDKVKVWKNEVNEDNFLKDEKVLCSMDYYKVLFYFSTKQNDREKVLKNTYDLNETLHKKDIDEKNRSQFVGTSLLYIKDVLKKLGINEINDDSRINLLKYLRQLSASQIRSGISETLENLLDGSDNKALKIELLQKNVLNDQKVRKLKTEDWVQVLDEIVSNIYRYINVDTSEGQDILNLFFIAFNKYTGKADKNQAFTPDHITNFMCRITDVDYTKRIFDGTCGSGSFLVQAMVLELADCNRQRISDSEKMMLREKIVKEHIYGIEIEEKAFGLSTTNMLIHGDGNSNIKKASLSDSEEFLRKANPDIILMNPPYNAKPITIPERYKSDWKRNAKEDPTKGLVFLKYISDVLYRINQERLNRNQTKKEIKVAILLPVSVAVNSKNTYILNMKKELLVQNSLEAVFSLPNEIFYPGASASACCMIFTLGKPHRNADGSINKTFFGYYKDDGHKKKKNLGRIEQFDRGNNSIWKQIENKWVDLYRNKTVVDGLSAMHEVNGEDEWLCEAYMKTNYDELTEVKFQENINNYLSFLVKEGKWEFFMDNINSFSSSTQVIHPESLELKPQAWQEFKINDLFKKKRIKHFSSIPEDQGSIPFVSSSSINNGVTSFVNEKPIEGNCITVSTNGECFDCFYQPDSICVSNDVEVLYNTNLNVYNALFIITVLMLEKKKYSYGRKAKNNKVYDTVIKLPVSSSNKPDWRFMENYIKTLFIKKIKKYN